MTNTASMAHAKASLSELASRASAGERILLVRRGKPVAALVGIADLEAIEARGNVSSFVEALDAWRRRHRAMLPARALRIRRSKGRRPT